MAEIIYYVNTDVSGGAADGSSLANAYSSLNACLTARAVNLVGSGNSVVILCYATAGTADTTACDTSGWGASFTSGETLTIKCGQTLTAAWNESIYRIQAANVAYVFRCYGSGIILEGLQIYLTGLNVNYQLALSVTNSSVNNPQVIKNCIIRSANQGTYRERAIYFSIGANRQVYFYNNIVYGVTKTVAHTASSGFYMGGVDATSLLIAYKNVFSGGYVNYFYSAGTLKLINNIFCNSANALVTNTPSYTASDYNATDKSAMTGGAHDRVNQTFTFVDAANGDFTLTEEDEGALTYGVTLSTETPAVATDRLGIAITSPFDIGAYQFVYGGVSLLSGNLDSRNLRGLL